MMTKGFLGLSPTSLSVAHVIEAQLAILRCTIQGREATYLSTPITSGRRLVDWLHSGGANLPDPISETYRREHRRLVVEPNLASARQVIAKLRMKKRTIIIDPTAFLDMDGWLQRDYRCLWERVIGEFVKTAVFLDGWEYSDGCVFEYVVALNHKARVVNQRLAMLSYSEGLALIERAIRDVQAQRGRTDYLELAWRHLSGAGA